jgi:hypothetical protein
MYGNAAAAQCTLECYGLTSFELAFMSWQSVSADGNKYTIPSIETGESISD